MAQDPAATSNNDADTNNQSPSPQPLPQPKSTPSPSKDNVLKLKYANFVKRVKISAQKAKDEARRKRLQQRKIRSYKHNHRIITAQQNRKNYTISTQKLTTAHSNPISSSQSQSQPPSNPTDIDNENEATEIKEQNDENGSSSNIMDDDWECIVIYKKPSPPRPILKKAQTAPVNGLIPSSSTTDIPIPKKAPPPIPHERRADFERVHKRTASNPVTVLFNQIAKKRKEKKIAKSSIANGNASIAMHGNDNRESTSYDEDAFDMDSDINNQRQKAVMNHMMQSAPDLRENEVNENKKEQTRREVIIDIKWQWKDDSGDWHNYGASTSKEMEQFYQNNEEKYEYDIFGRIYFIDFKEMKQFNNLNQAWDVRRNEIKQEVW